MGDSTRDKFMRRIGQVVARYHQPARAIAPGSLGKARIALR